MQLALARKDFFDSVLAPRLVDSASSKEFLAAPSSFLKEADFPGIAEVALERSQQLDELLSGELALSNPTCTIPLRIALTAVVAVGSVLTVGIVKAIGIALAPFTGGWSAAIAVMAKLGIVAGATFTREMADKLVDEICK